MIICKVKKSADHGIAPTTFIVIGNDAAPPYGEAVIYDKI